MMMKRDSYKRDSLLPMIMMFLFLHCFCLINQSESTQFVLSVFSKQQKFIWPLTFVSALQPLPLNNHVVLVHDQAVTSCSAGLVAPSTRGKTDTQDSPREKQPKLQ